MKWDDEVDVVVTGAGAAGLGSAMAVVELGGSVFVADPSAAEAAAVRPSLGAGVSDTETTDYFAAMVPDSGPMQRSSYDGEVPVRAIHRRPPAESGRMVAPFVGSRLRDWAARCLSTPYGYLYTRLPDWHSTTAQTTDGEIVEVAEIGTMTPDPDDVGGSILDWMTAQAQGCDIEPTPDTALKRIVFEEGVAVGAVFETSGGPLAIRARHGVTVACASWLLVAPSSGRLPAGAAVQICLTGQRASRFGRLELLTSDSVASSAAPTCRAVNRRLQVSLHESHDQSRVWRCGKMRGHPSDSR